MAKWRWKKKDAVAAAAYIDLGFKYIVSRKVGANVWQHLHKTKTYKYGYWYTGINPLCINDNLPNIPYDEPIRLQSIVDYYNARVPECRRIRRR